MSLGLLICIILYLYLGYMVVFKKKLFHKIEDRYVTEADILLKSLFLTFNILILLILLVISFNVTII